MREGSTITRMINKTSRNQATAIPRYGKMPMGASPASCLGGLLRAGRMADLNSSHGEDHSTSSRGGSGHWITVSGMVSTVLTQPQYRAVAPSEYLHGLRAPFWCHSR